MPYINISFRIYLFVIILVVTVTGTVTYHTVENTYIKILEYQAVNVAEIVANQAIVSRTVYSRIAVSKLKKEGTGGHISSQKHSGHIPLPAQFLKEIGKLASSNENGLYQFRPISKWNIEPTQGLNDDFQKWAWDQLELQDNVNPTQAIQWTPSWRIEEVNGENTLRYLKADPASSASCVACHNYYENTAKIITSRLDNNQPIKRQWKQHQLLGALEVSIPLNKVRSLANTQTRNASFVIVGIIIVLASLFSWFLYRNVTCFRDMGKMSNMVIKDSLTGVLNRRGFDLRVREFAYSAINHDQQHILMYIDLDHFKQVNDQFGHPMGDKILSAVSEVMISCTRDSDEVARIGGDEFAILLESCTKEKGLTIAQTITDNIANLSFNCDNKKLTVTVSIGISFINTSTCQHNAFIRHADKALYSAKHAGKNQVSSYKE